jgi:hypothetical protein
MTQRIALSSIQTPKPEEGNPTTVRKQQERLAIQSYQWTEHAVGTNDGRQGRISTRESDWTTGAGSVVVSVRVVAKGAWLGK